MKTFITVYSDDGIKFLKYRIKLLTYINNSGKM